MFLRRLQGVTGFVSCLLCCVVHSALARSEYYGLLVGDLKTQVHDVKGTVYVADERTLFVRDFHYDGQGPDAFFWGDTENKPTQQGFIIPLLNESENVLKEYRGQNLILRLPERKYVKDIKSLAVWCRKFSVNFGHLTFPQDFQAPQVVNLGPLSSLAHGVRSEDVMVKDTKTILIKNLYYDGAGPDAFFLVGSGSQPHPDGTKVPDENGSLEKLHGYTGQDVEIRLPGDLTVFDIDWLALYCIRFKQNFGHVTFTSRIENIPPNLKILQEVNFDNCEEIVPGVLHVSWKIQEQHLLMQMAGKIEENEYMSFGRSGDEDRAVMIGADVAVAFYDPAQKKAKVVDYFLSGKFPCSGGSGSCPDEELGGTNDAEIISYQQMDGILRVNFKRPLSSNDDQDLSMPLSVPVSVVAAIGPLNSKMQVMYHSRYYNKESKKIQFGRVPAQDRCAPLEPAAEHMEPKAWKPNTISGPTTFRAQIGPSGGDKGYKAITGSQSWGIAWWINDLLLPEITVRRGVNYTFSVEGGDDPSNTAKYHPFYITNNPEGGAVHVPEQIGTPNHIVYAGISIDQNQRVTPTGAGRYCEWKHVSTDQWQTSVTFEDYRRTLKLECDSQGHPAVFTWVPDENTPDTVYYQCFFHRYLGWKINVVDADSSTMAMGHLQDSGSSPTGGSGHAKEAHHLFFIFLCSTFFLM